MHTIRLDQKNPFVSIPKIIIQTTKLDATEKALYLVLYDITNNSTDLQSFPDKEFIMQRLGMKSKKTLHKYLLQLEEHGLLQVIRNKTANGMDAASTYVVQSTHILEDAAQIVADFIQQLKMITSTFAIELSDQQWETLVKTAYDYVGEQAVSVLIVKLLNKELQAAPDIVAAICQSFVEDDEAQTTLLPLKHMLSTVFAEVTAQDYETLQRLANIYPSGVIQFALESVKGKNQRMNWGYITATIKRLAQENHTYEECQASTAAFYAQQDAEQAKVNAEKRSKKNLILRLIELGVFGEVFNRAAYAKKILNEELYQDFDVYELFDHLTGVHHHHAYEYDQKTFRILYGD